MELTDTQLNVLSELYKFPSGRPFREDSEKTAIDEMCRMVPPLVCDPHNMGSSLFTMITREGRVAYLGTIPCAIED
jgi:hypothetical protein